MTPLEPRLYDQLCRAVAEERAARWGYIRTLAEQDLQDYVREETADENLRADMHTALRFLAGSGLLSLPPSAVQRPAEPPPGESALTGYTESAAGR